jgi:hypothetical protein
MVYIWYIMANRSNGYIFIPKSCSDQSSIISPNSQPPSLPSETANFTAQHLSKWQVRTTKARESRTPATPPSQSLSKDRLPKSSKTNFQILSTKRARTRRLARSATLPAKARYLRRCKKLFQRVLKRLSQMRSTILAVLRRSRFDGLGGCY